LLDPKSFSRSPKAAVMRSGDRKTQMSQFDLCFQGPELLL